MSYNIDSVTLLSCVEPLRISREAAARWAAKEDKVPEGLSDAVRDWAKLGAPESLIIITDKLTWTGDFSGHRYNDSLADFAADTTGDASFLLTWAGGDSQTGLRIADGKAYEHKVDIALGKFVGMLTEPY